MYNVLAEKTKDEKICELELKIESFESLIKKMNGIHEEYVKAQQSEQTNDEKIGTLQLKIESLTKKIDGIKEEQNEEVIALGEYVSELD